ncbi:MULTISPECIES: complex I subunit 5 family protein [unclassified Fusibacter]|uniref:complex I subunit 5 family protein n=1 Tax=unclassified Fusibacter TaxID=2624464 RepID=UPI001013A2D2|nr:MULTISPECIES: proton-conducting transporter membrane subunit [unclassified Fusibacter]MCK8061078.1 hypothetical protein [Fusibacter sp. A2]NPE23386.1 hypothetical protein [Fusibacter sp. A1]RXV59431.1 hypothetical protein DWB64_16330 [Fusibacter sp. A1]
MGKLMMLLPMVIPIIVAVLLTNRKWVSDKNITKVVGATVFINFFIVVFVLFYNKTGTFHLIKVNNFLDIYFKVDQLSRLFSLMASVLWILTSFYAFEYMKHNQRVRQFYLFFTLTLGVVIGLSFSGNLFTLYIYYELLTLSTFPLVIHNGTERALESGKKYVIYSFSGATLIVFGMMILYSITGTMNFTPKGILTLAYGVDNKMLLVSYVAMFLGFGVKSALVPFHSWLPSAMVAPTPVSALLHAVAVVKSGIFSLIRITYFVFGASVVSGIGATTYLVPFVVLTVVMGSLLALHQDHLKKRLAYSTISQLGYMILGILLLNPLGLLGALLQMINHAVIKITLFFIVGTITHQTGNKYIHQINGMGRRMPVTFISFTIAALSLIGIPPTNGFVSKWFLGLGALDASNMFYVFILLISAFLTAAYLLPITVTAFFTNQSVPEGIEADEGENAVSLDPPKMMLAPIVILTLVIIMLGLFPNIVINFINPILSSVF